MKKQKALPTIIQSAADIDIAIFMADTISLMKYDANRQLMVAYHYPYTEKAETRSADSTPRANPHTVIRAIERFITSEPDVLAFKILSQAAMPLEDFKELCQKYKETPNVFIRRSILLEPGVICAAKPYAPDANVRVYIPFRFNDTEFLHRYVISRVKDFKDFFTTVLEVPEDDPALASMLLRLEIGGSDL